MALDVDTLAGRLKRSGITNLVVWGLKKKFHTHRYIHKAVYHAFKAIADHGGLTVDWYDDDRKSASLDPSPARNYLIFCSPHYDFARHLPIIPNGYYIAHADSDLCYDTKKPIPDLTGTRAAVYWKSFRGFPEDNSGFEALDPVRLVFVNKAEHKIMMPWATDLLPGEIDAVKQEVIARHAAGRLFPGKRVLFVGTVWKRNRDLLHSFSKLCKKVKLDFRVENIEDTTELIAATQAAYMAPALQGEGHMESKTKFYVPCRIMKNISYGALGVTNNYGVNAMFQQRLIYSQNLEEMIDNYRDVVGHFSREEFDKMLSLIDEVRDHHTYLNRISECLTALEMA